MCDMLISRTKGTGVPTAHPLVSSLCLGPRSSGSRPRGSPTGAALHYGCSPPSGKCTLPSRGGPSRSAVPCSVTTPYCILAPGGGSWSPVPEPFAGFWNKCRAGHTLASVLRCRLPPPAVLPFPRCFPSPLQSPCTAGGVLVWSNTPRPPLLTAQPRKGAHLSVRCGEVGGRA